jgi:NAD+ kinase
MTGCAKRILIIANLDKDDAGGIAREMGARLEKFGAKADIFAFSGPPGAAPDFRGIDLVVSLGGDGTVLYAARQVAASGVPILPFNLGRLGFIAGFQRGEWETALEYWFAGKLALSSRALLELSIHHQTGEVESFLALNDGVISARGIAKVIALEVRVAGTNLGTYRSDGVLVSTPTGSTAYNLAAGGPVLHPEMDAMILNPICPFTLWNRPLVVPGNELIEIEVEKNKRTDVMITVDGQETLLLSPGDVVSFKLASFRVAIYSPRRETFYETLRTKLTWSGGPDA